MKLVNNFTKLFLCCLITIPIMYILSNTANQTIINFSKTQQDKIIKDNTKVTTETDPLYLHNVLTESKPNRPKPHEKKYTEFTPLILEDKVNNLPKLKELADRYEKKYSNRKELVGLYDNTKDSVFSQYKMKKRLEKMEDEKKHYYDPNKSNSLIR